VPDLDDLDDVATMPAAAGLWTTVAGLVKFGTSWSSLLPDGLVGTADYQSPSLAHYAAGSALELLIHGLYQSYREGIVTRGVPSHNLAVTMTKTSLGTPESKVTDCSDDSGAVAYSKSGKPVAGEAPGRQAISAQVQPFDGTWKVTYLVVEKTGSC